MPSRTWPARPATRTMKNSSRLSAEIDRKRSLSSSGCLVLRASSRTPPVELKPGKLAIDETRRRHPVVAMGATASASPPCGCSVVVWTISVISRFFRSDSMRGLYQFDPKAVMGAMPRKDDMIATVCRDLEAKLALIVVILAHECGGKRTGDLRLSRQRGLVEGARRSAGRWPATARCGWRYSG